MIALTSEQAQLIIDEHEIELDDECSKVLWERNPELADAYSVLLAIAEEIN